jgi:hypothetical protein
LETEDHRAGHGTATHGQQFAEIKVVRQHDISPRRAFRTISMSGKQ